MKKHLLIKIVCLASILLTFASCATLSKSEKEATAHYRLGLSQLNSNNIQAAYVEFQKALKLNDSDKEIHNAIGIVYMKLDDFGSAERSFKRAVSIDWDYSEAYNNLCFLYVEKREFEKSIEYCDKALKNQLYPTPEKALYNLGRAHYRLGNYNEAIKNFSQATKRAPMMFQSFYGLALAYNAIGNYGKASEAINKAIAVDSRFRGDTALAESEFRKQSMLGGQEAKDIIDMIEILKY